MRARRGVRCRIPCREQYYATLIGQPEQHFQRLFLGKHPECELAAMEFGRNRLKIECSSPYRSDPEPWTVRVRGITRSRGAG
jgi:hypothetical protein